MSTPDIPSKGLLKSITGEKLHLGTFPVRYENNTNGTKRAVVGPEFPGNSKKQIIDEVITVRRQVRETKLVIRDDNDEELYQGKASTVDGNYVVVVRDDSSAEPVYRVMPISSLYNFEKALSVQSVDNQLAAFENSVRDSKISSSFVMNLIETQANLHGLDPSTYLSNRDDEALAVADDYDVSSNNIDIAISNIEKSGRRKKPSSNSDAEEEFLGGADDDDVPVPLDDKELDVIGNEGEADERAVDMDVDYFQDDEGDNGVQDTESVDAAIADEEGAEELREAYAPSLLDTNIVINEEEDDADKLQRQILKAAADVVNVNRSSDEIVQERKRLKTEQGPTSHTLRDIERSVIDNDEALITYLRSIFDANGGKILVSELGKTLDTRPHSKKEKEFLKESLNSVLEMISKRETRNKGQSRDEYFVLKNQ